MEGVQDTGEDKLERQTITEDRESLTKSSSSSVDCFFFLIMSLK